MTKENITWWLQVRKFRLSEVSEGVVPATSIKTLFAHAPIISKQISSQNMPRPARKPKRFNAQPQLPSEEVVAPVASTPVHQRQSTTGLASPGLSPIVRENDFTIYDETDPQSDEFGFSKVKGIRKPIKSNHINSDIEESLEEDENDVDDNLAEEDEEDLYGLPLPSMTKGNVTRDSDNVEPSPAPVQITQPKPKKPVRKLRTSELLPLLPARRKRQQTSNIREKMAAINTSEPESDSDVPVKRKPVKKRRVAVADKENDGPVSSDDDEAEDSGVEERRKVVKAQFAKVDQWEMVFETVDLSFSSQ
jgi:hypothetical protein